MKLTNEDITNILNLINRVSNITGQEAIAVAVLQQKLNGLKDEEKVEEVKNEVQTETDKE